jgi:hypothetical protein
VLIGIIVVGVNRARRVDEAPRAGIDHWHMAYGLYVCDRYLAPIRGGGDQNGIHSHGDGVVHVEALDPSSSGSNAVFRRFEEAEGLRVTSSSVRFLDGTVPVEASVSDGCDGRPAEVATFVDGKRTKGDPGGIRLRNGHVIVVALLPKGTPYAQIGDPPSARYLRMLQGP